ncbi:MAG TPA: proline dehydrogenase family protein [Phycisphaerae bacterium]|nr:proline dehydrogenase family protein [Phycisphaerae bacterium]
MRAKSAIDPSRLETTTRRIGEEIFRRAEAAAPSILSQEYWQTRGMEWLTRDEDLKLRLFRFIEALPSLQTPEEIARRLKETVDRNGEHGRPLPLAFQAALSYRRNDSWHAGLVAWAARYAALRAATQFICGSTPREAIESVLQLRQSGMAFTLDVLGETVHSDRVAEELQQLYIRLVEQLSLAAPGWPAAPILDSAPWGTIPRVNVSIKLTGIVANLDPADPTAADAVLARLRPILRAAMRHGAFINIDVEHYAIKNVTLDLYQRMLSEPEFSNWPDCGIVIQAYLVDGERDMAGLIDWARRRGTPITVRLVKGAYWDTETAEAIREGRPIPVFTEKWQSDASFERITRMMIDNADIIRPAFASHNVRSIAHALALEESSDLPPRTIELQMLTGMGDPLKRAVVDMGQRLRVYAPFGQLIPGMAYLIRRLIENTANESFLRQSFGGQVPIAELLRMPGPEQSVRMAKSK